MNWLNFNLSVLPVRVSCWLLCTSAKAGGSVATVSEADVSEKIVCTENGLCSIFSIINRKQSWCTQSRSLYIKCATTIIILLKAVRMFYLNPLLFKQHNYQSSVLKYHKLVKRSHDGWSGLPRLAGGSGLLAFPVRLVQTGLCPGRVLDGRKVICRTGRQAHHRVDAWIRRPTRGQGQRLRSHGRGCVGAVREGLWWRFALSCAGQLWQLTYHL